MPLPGVRRLDLWLVVPTPFKEGCVPPILPTWTTTTGRTESNGCPRVVVLVYLKCAGISFHPLSHLQPQACIQEGPHVCIATRPPAWYTRSPPGLSGIRTRVLFITPLLGSGLIGISFTFHSYAIAAAIASVGLRFWNRFWMNSLWVDSGFQCHCFTFGNGIGMISVLFLFLDPILWNDQISAFSDPFLYISFEYVTL